MKDSELFVTDHAPLTSSISRNAPEWEQAYARLHSFAIVLVNSIRGQYDEIHHTLEENGPILDGCPSRASFAELVFRSVGEKLDEVKAAHKDVLTGMWKVS